MLTYYQQTLLATLIDYSYQAVELLKENYNVSLIIRWRRLIKRIEVHFQLPSFFVTSWELSFADSLCNKDETPEVLIDTQRFMILRELLEFSKVLVKSVKQSEEIYDIRNAVYRLIHLTLPNQFGFSYLEHQKCYPLRVNLTEYLSLQGMIEIQLIDKDTVWVHPHNFNESTYYYSKGIFLHEAEGLCYLGGENLLNRIIESCRCSLQETIHFRKGSRLNK